MSLVVKLQEEELDVLMQYPTDSETTDAAVRDLLGKLRSQVNGEESELSLSEEDLQTIQTYVSGNGNGNIDENLRQVFERISAQNE